MKRVILTGGGTGGHCLPMQVLFNNFVEKKLDCYIVTDKKGKSFFTSIDPGKVIVLWQVMQSNGRILQLFNLPIILLQSMIIFLRLNPNFTIGFGGYITFPFLIAGSLLKYKVAAHEANAVLGKANKFLMGRIKYLFTAFHETKNIHENYAKKIIHVGMPVRLYTDSMNRKESDDKHFNISVIGGSQGASSFSNFVPKAIIMFQSQTNIPCIVNHQTRKDDLILVKNAYSSSQVDSCVEKFFPDMPRRIFESDLIISRSGSSTANEIIHYGKPSILVPYPYATDNHQYYNALVLEKILGSKIILDQELNVEGLCLEILKFFKDINIKKDFISNSISRQSYINPCERIYSLIRNDL